MSLFDRRNVEDWLDMIEKDNAVAILWSVNDIIDFLANEGIEISLSQAQQVLRLMRDNHDAEVGISWNEVGYWAKEVLNNE